MLKTIFTSLLLFAPVVSSSFCGDNLENTPVLQEKIDIKSVESDEFLSYWQNDFRKDDNDDIIPICDIKYEDYTVMYTKYAALNNVDREIIDSTPDYEDGFTIKDSIVELVRIYGKRKNTSDLQKHTLNQSSAITIIVVIAVFGMSVICLFYVMKNNNLIQ